MTANKKILEAKLEYHEGLVKAHLKEIGKLKGELYLYNQSASEVDWKDT